MFLGRRFYVLTVVVPFYVFEGTAANCFSHSKV